MGSKKHVWVAIVNDGNGGWRIFEKLIVSAASKAGKAVEMIAPTLTVNNI